LSLLTALSLQRIRKNCGEGGEEGGDSVEDTTLTERMRKLNALQVLAQYLHFCKDGLQEELGSELMAVRSRGTKSKTWAVFSVWKASLGGNCDNTGEGEGV
jgi:hypothetical protein